MSHTVSMKLKINDLATLAKAAESIGLEFRKDQRSFKAYTTDVCDHALRVKGNKKAYEIGVRANRNGTYDLLFDSFLNGEGLMSVIGANGSKLMQAYQQQMALAHIPFGYEALPVQYEGEDMLLDFVKY